MMKINSSNCIIVPMISLVLLSSSGIHAADKGKKKKSKSKTKTKNIVVKYEPEKEKKYKLIPLDTLSFDSVDAVCRPMLSKGGILIYEKKRNSVLVYDTDKVIKKIQAFVKTSDREAVNIRIEIDYQGSGYSNNSGLNVYTDYGRGYTKPKVIIKNGKVVKAKRIAIDANVRRNKTSRNTTQFITTRSGSPATLWVGKTIVDPSWLNNQVNNPTVIVKGKRGGTVVIPGTDMDFKWADVGASLQVLPFYYDDGTIDVEVYPVLSYLDGKGKRKAVKVESVSTRLRVKDGQRVPIGGLISSKKKEYIKLFGPDFYRSIQDGNVLDMYLTARVIRPGSNRRFTPIPRGRR